MFDTGRSTEMHEHTYMISTPKHAIHSPWLVRRQPQTVHEYYLNVHPSDQSTTDYNWCWGERQHSDSTPKTDSEWTLIYKGNSKETSHFMAKKTFLLMPTRHLNPLSTQTLGCSTPELYYVYLLWTWFLLGTWRVDRWVRYNMFSPIHEFWKANSIIPFSGCWPWHGLKTNIHYNPIPRLLES